MTCCIEGPCLVDANGDIWQTVVDPQTATAEFFNISAGGVVGTPVAPTRPCGDAEPDGYHQYLTVAADGTAVGANGETVTAPAGAQPGDTIGVDFDPDGNQTDASCVGKKVTLDAACNNILEITQETDCTQRLFVPGHCHPLIVKAGIPNRPSQLLDASVLQPGDEFVAYGDELCVEFSNPTCSTYIEWMGHVNAFDLETNLAEGWEVEFEVQFQDPPDVGSGTWVTNQSIFHDRSCDERDAGVCRKMTSTSMFTDRPYATNPGETKQVCWRVLVRINEVGAFNSFYKIQNFRIRLIPNSISNDC